MALVRQILILLVSLLALPVFAEQVYVDDTLRVLVRSTPDSRKSPVTTVVSGDKLEVLEREGDDDVKIRTEDGDEGWLKARYITDETPPRQVLAELQKKHEELQKETVGLRESNRRLGETSARQSQTIESLQAERDRLKGERDTLQTSIEQREQSKESDQRNKILTLAGALLFLFVLGYVLGIRKMRRHIRERLGGMDV